MSKFDRYLLSQLMVLFGFFSLVLVAIYWVNYAVGLFDRLIADGQTALVFLEFSFLALPDVIRLILPISAFVATVYGINRLVSESELVVMQATGLSAFQLARPVVYFGLCVSVMLLILSNLLVPVSQKLLRERSAQVAENMSARYLKEGQFMQPVNGITLYIRRIGGNGALHDLFLADDRNPDHRLNYFAQQAFLLRSDTGPKLIMLAGMMQDLSATGQLAVTDFADFTYDLSDVIKPPEQAKRNLNELSTMALLRAAPDMLAATGKTKAVFWAEAHSRLAAPFMAPAVSLIGFSALLLGSFSRFGLWRQIGMAVGLLIVVQLVNTLSLSASLRHMMAWPLIYAAPLLGMMIGFMLLWAGQRPVRLRQNGGAQ